MIRTFILHSLILPKVPQPYLGAGLSLVLQLILDLDETLSEFLRLTAHANLEGLN